MTLHIIVATASEEVSRYVGIKKRNIISKEVRDSNPDLLGNCIVASILVKPGQVAAERIAEYLSVQDENRTAVIIIVESTLAKNVTNKFADSCFTFVFDSELMNRTVQNYFNTFMPRLLRAFDYFAKKFDQQTFRKIFILPLRNFKANELAEFHTIFKNGVVPRGFEEQVDKFLRSMRQRQSPKTKTTYSTLYFVDDYSRYFSYGDEKHALPDTKKPPHNDLCEINAYHRFGKRYEHNRHYNVALEEGSISGDFIDCHDVTVHRAATSHLNMFPNDFH